MTQFIGTGYHTPVKMQPLHPADYYAVLDEREAPSVVIFTGPACGACRRLKAILAEMAPIPDIIFFEVGAEQAGGLVEELEIFHLPALFLYQHGELHAEIHAVLQPHALRDAIEAARSAPAGLN
jgi:thioredoxin 1